MADLLQDDILVERIVEACQCKALEDAIADLVPTKRTSGFISSPRTFSSKMQMHHGQYKMVE